MFQSSPQATLFFLSTSIIVFALLFVINGSGLSTVPVLYFKIYAAVFCLIFFWWPIDLLIHWAKRSEAADRKDRLIACISLSAILFMFPYYWIGTPFTPTLITALGLGIFLPGLVSFILMVKNKKSVVNPGTMYRSGMESPLAQEFMRYFPDARQYVFGLTAGDGERAHVLLHHRKPYSRFEEANIDFVLDIPVDRKLESYVGGKEQLKCYLFINNEGRAGVAFLPSANIGKALDYGFSDEEIENAVGEAQNIHQEWGAIEFEPIPIQHYRGKYVRIR